MKTILVMTVGQTDVQLVVDNVRHELPKKRCGELHDELEKRGFAIVDAQEKQKGTPIEAFPESKLSVCTPKLDAVLRFFDDSLPTHALIFDTRRETPSDPRLAGRVVEQRLKERGVQVGFCTFLAGKEWLEDRLLEDRSNEIDAVVRRDVVNRLASAIRRELNETNFDRIVIAASGGLPAVNDVVKELVRLHAVGGAEVTSLEVPDGAFAGQDDRAIAEKFHPAAGYRARWHALSLVENGNLLGAWGAVGHLENEPGQEWATVLKWLGHFASSLPLPPECDLTVLSHQRMAVRAALRVELALRARDIPRAVHGTVAFFEAALWDKLNEKTTRHGTKNRLFRLDLVPKADLIREPDAKRLEGLSKSKQDEDRKKPFTFKEKDADGDWYRIDDSEVCAVRLAEHYIGSASLKSLGQAVNAGIRELRNDIAHNEPTPALMDDASRRMCDAQLWSNTDTFLSQPLVQNVLKELGEQCPEQLCINLVSTVRERLLAIS